MDDPWSSVAERTEEESGRVLLTYFQGDVSSMVDQHFSRALRQTKKPKREITKSSEKPAQTYELSSSQWGLQPIIPQTVPRLNPHVARDGPSSSVVWSGVSSDALPPVMCSSAGSTVNMTEHHYNHSLMNFLYNDRSALATMMLPTSRPDHITGWTPFPVFED